MKKLILAVLFFLVTVPGWCATYYVKNGGNDLADGLSDANAWETIAKVNVSTFSPGDSILFKRGDIWREQLIPSTGSVSGYITYGAYGGGDKPLLKMSIQRNQATDWTDLGGNIWQSVEPVGTGSELAPNTGFETNTSNWTLYNVAPSASTLSRTTTAGEFSTGSAGGKIACTGDGGAIEFWTASVSISTGKWYIFTFDAKTTNGFTGSAPILRKDTSPFTSYSTLKTTTDPVYTNSFVTYKYYYYTTATATDARIDFRIDSLANGEDFFIDNVSFKEATGIPFINDIGNIILGNHESFGIKVWEVGDLDSDLEYWYDETNDIVRIYSTSNPATRFSDVECCMMRDIIDGAFDYVVIEDLNISYGAAHGIGSSPGCDYNIVRDCDFTYIGGGDQYGGAYTTRYGNGLEWWGNSSNNLIERCLFYEIYDGGYSDEFGGVTSSIKQNNILRNNLFIKCHHSISIWNSNVAGSIIANMQVYHNACLYAGGEWSYSQRPGGDSAWHILGWGTASPNISVSNVVIKNNIFFESTLYCVRLPSVLTGITLDNNLIYQTSGNPYWIGGNLYDSLSAYQSATGQDLHSIATDPLLNSDYTLKSRSPCIDSGVDVGVQRDYANFPRPSGKGWDMGAYEFNQNTVQIQRMQKPTAEKLQLKSIWN